MRLHDLTLGELRDLADAAVLIAAAADAGLFGALADGPRGAEELAEELGYDTRATRIVREALVEIGLLERDGGRHRPSARCRRELCDPESETYAGRGLPHWLRSVRAATHLGEVLRRGGPVEERPAERSTERLANFVSAMAAAPAERVERIVELCLERRPRAETVLDLGGGPGHMTRAFVSRGLRGTLLDTPDVVAHVVDAFGLGDVQGLEVVAGDFTEALPPGPFDVVLASNVIHIYGPEVNRRLFRDVAEVVAPGGVVAVADFFRGRSGRAAHMGLMMLLRSEQGDAYAEEAVAGWLEEAGFGKIRVDEVDEDRHLMTGVKT
ncbi:MAG TPA: class I SAM-dependent methyltransferase [Longimicrobiales bacterium]|nr:class I SAM-dependent methyltransferase [Longimicrobiales bacterium]